MVVFVAIGHSVSGGVVVAGGVGACWLVVVCWVGVGGGVNIGDFVTIGIGHGGYFGPVDECSGGCCVDDVCDRDRSGITSSKRSGDWSIRGDGSVTVVSPSAISQDETCGWVVNDSDVGYWVRSLVATVMLNVTVSPGATVPRFDPSASCLINAASNTGWENPKSRVWLF